MYSKTHLIVWAVGRSIPIRKWVPWSAVVKIAAFHCTRAWGRRSFPIWTGCLPATVQPNTTPGYHLKTVVALLQGKLVSEIMLSACISFSSFADTASVSGKNLKQVVRARRRARDWRESTPAPSRACAPAPWHCSEASTMKPHLHTWNRTMNVSLAGPIRSSR